MARPLSWLPRLADIRRSVAGSVRTHYDRPALELLFQMQPRAAGKLLAMLPQGAPLGCSRLVEKEALLQFLDKIHEADNATEVYARQRAEKGNVSRKKPRLLVRRELVTEASLDNLPKGLLLEPGRLEVRFRNKMEALEALAVFVGVVENDLEEFERRFCETAASPEDRDRLRAEANDIQNLFGELRQMEANRAHGAN